MSKYKYWNKDSERINELNLNKDIKFIQWKEDNELRVRNRYEEDVWIDYCEENKISYDLSLLRQTVMTIGFGGYDSYLAYMSNQNK